MNFPAWHANLHLRGSGLLHVLPQEVVRELELHEALGQELGNDAVHVLHYRGAPAG